MFWKKVGDSQPVSEGKTQSKRGASKQAKTSQNGHRSWTAKQLKLNKSRNTVAARNDLANGGGTEERRYVCTPGLMRNRCVLVREWGAGGCGDQVIGGGGKVRMAGTRKIHHQTGESERGPRRWEGNRGRECVIMTILRKRDKQRANYLKRWRFFFLQRWHWE